MKKRLFFIILLFLVNYLSFRYLRSLMEERIVFYYKNDCKPLIYQKKEIILDDVSDFMFDDHFKILSFEDHRYIYHFDENMLIVQIDQESYRYPYQIREPDIITVEKIVYKETEKNDRPSVQKQENDQKDQEENIYETEKDYFRLKQKNISFEKGTDISVIIASIKDLVDTNMDITIDYSQLNPNDPGAYDVFFITQTEKYAVSVQIS